ncbi:hypothetical protein BGP_6467 [Beggiatoa sp. PS]|nr:hypothetical protein BGP_6467 [Beggiatoa sp. PS]
MFFIILQFQYNISIKKFILAALGSFNGIGSRIPGKGDCSNRNDSMKYVVFIRFFGQIDSLFISPFPLLIEAIPLNDPSAILAYYEVFLSA